MDNIAAEQLLNALQQEIQIWVASHNPGTATTVAELIESYHSAHSPLGNRVRTRYQDYRPLLRPLSKDSFQQGKQKSEGSSRNNPWETSHYWKSSATSVIRRYTSPRTALQRLSLYRKEQRGLIHLRKEKSMASLLRESCLTVEPPELW